MKKGFQEVYKKLKENGFELKRIGKHEIWSDGERNIAVPESSISPMTAKSIINQIERKGHFYHKQQKHLRKE